MQLLTTQYYGSEVNMFSLMTNKPWKDFCHLAANADVCEDVDQFQCHDTEAEASAGKTKLKQNKTNKQISKHFARPALI